MQLCSSLSILWHCLSLGLEWKLTFSSPVATAEFSKFAGILSAAHSQHHFRIWNSSPGIPSPPLALFVAMLSKAHLTSHSKMSGYRLVIISSWLSPSTYQKTLKNWGSNRNVNVHSSNMIAKIWVLPSVHQWMSKCGLSTPCNIIQPETRREFWYLLQHG